MSLRMASPGGTKFNTQNGPYLLRYSSDHSSLGVSSDRPLCHQPKHETPKLRVTYSRSTGMGGGSTKHLLEEHSRLHLSSNSTVTQSGPENTVLRMQAHPYSSGLANETMVLGSGGTVTQPSETTPTNSLSIQTTTEQPIPLSPRVPQFPRMVSRSTTIPDPQAWAVEALNISWKNIVGYTFPPTAMLPRVVQKILS